MFKLMEPFSEIITDVDAALSRNFPSAETDVGKDAHAEAIKGKRKWKHRANDSQP